MKKRIILIIIAILITVLGVTLVSYFYFKGKGNTNTNTNTNTPNTNEITLKESYKITKGGTYTFTGSIKDGSITVNTPDGVKIILNSVEINNTKGPAINIISNGDVEIELVGDNKLSDGSSYEDTELDGCINSKADLKITGDGSLSIIANYKDGIVSKDDLEILGGTISVTSADDGIKGKDSVVIEKAIITINSGGSGIKSTNDEDATKGYIEIKSGTFIINAVDNGIKSITKLTINGGTFNIRAAEGLESTYIVINDGEITISASDDGINASAKSTYMTPTIEINGGKIDITMDQGDTDALDANGNLYINNGELTINAQSPFDYDNEGKLNGGTVIVNGEQVSELTNQFMGGPNGGEPPRW